MRCVMWVQVSALACVLLCRMWARRAGVGSCRSVCEEGLAALAGCSGRQAQSGASERVVSQAGAERRKRARLRIPLSVAALHMHVAIKHQRSCAAGFARCCARHSAVLCSDGAQRFC